MQGVRIYLRCNAREYIRLSDTLLVKMCRPHFIRNDATAAVSCRCAGCEKIYTMQCRRIHKTFWHLTRTCDALMKPSSPLLSLSLPRSLSLSCTHLSLICPPTVVSTCVAVCCSALLCVAVRCSALTCVAVCCSFQGGKYASDYLSCMSLFAKEPLKIELFCRKWPV